MLLNLIRWLRGYVVFEAVGKFPERFMNLCVHQGRFFFNAVPVKDNGRFKASLLVSDYKSIRPLCRRCSVRLKVAERHGLPFILARYRNRKGLLYGALAFFIIIIAMQSFVWTVEVKGLTSISTTQMEEKLREQGVYVGAFKGSRNLHAVERSIMQEFDNISWMSINLIGTKAEVEIKEKELKPHIIESDVPCNVKAKRDGQIVSMDIRKGSTELPVGSAVKEGQLIVSGVVKNSLEQNFLVHADAEVMAQTKHKKTFSCDKSYSGMIVSDIKVRKNVDFYALSFPLSLTNVAGSYTSYPEKFRLCFNDTIIPVGVTEETCTVYEEKQFAPNKETATEILKKDEALYRLFCLQDAEGIKAKVQITQSKGDYICEVTYECLEDIAVQEEIIVN